jgi:ATP-dependent DNA helicase RecG
MDENRTFISVTLPIHPYFRPKNNLTDKELTYQNKIKKTLKKKTLSMNELSKLMGYKGISKKLSKTIKQMLQTKQIEKTISNSYIKYQLTKEN